MCFTSKRSINIGYNLHAAGLIGQLGASSTITKLRKYSLDLYKELEITTGLSTGSNKMAITVASSQERMQELLRQATTAQLSNVEVEVLQKKNKRIVSVVKNEDLIGGVYMPKDGQADPVELNGWDKAAKMLGVQIFEKSPVKKF